PLARVDYRDYDYYGDVANWNVVYYHNNPIGTPIKTSNHLGQISWNAQLDPFGKATPVNPAITQNLRFPGQYYDQETGLHYNMARYYDPAIGRYLQSDPIGLSGGINTYTYALNNPIRYTDPLGLLTVVIVNNNTPIIGTHAGVYVERNGDQTLFDPGGSYQAELKGSGDTLTGEDANLLGYIHFQLEDGPDVQLYPFNTTPAEEKRILENISQGGCSVGLCSTCSGSVLQGIGPFKNLGGTPTPSILGNALRQLQGR
ncbi:RHS repeat-associated core domain-containing protein, partial [Methylomonas subterranea]|uniref:RHS repeat-associated core domain-containing protein n=1 Tax=Methylomonas subterranea TaxID=2952225 RepID=UPI00273BD3E6